MNVDAARPTDSAPPPIRPEPADTPAAQACLHAYYAELATRFPEGFDLDATVSADPDECRPPHGQFLVAWDGETPVGCGALKTLAPGVGEIKRMWVHPSMRGSGLGGRLLAQLEHEARVLGMVRVRLDTHARLDEAIALYRTRGYRAIERYNDNPYAHHWFEKDL